MLLQEFDITHGVHDIDVLEEMKHFLIMKLKKMPKKETEEVVQLRKHLIRVTKEFYKHEVNFKEEWQLPEEIWGIIMSFLDQKSIRSHRLLSQLMCRICTPLIYFVNYNFSSLEKLENVSLIFPKLSTLKISKCKIENLCIMPQITHLSLSAKFNEVLNILHFFPNLKVLDARKLFVNLSLLHSILSKLPYLESLYVEFIFMDYEVDEINLPIHGLKRFEMMCGHYEEINQIIRSFPELRELNGIALSNSGFISHPNLVNLSMLNANYQCLSSTIENCPKLEKLHCFADYGKTIMKTKHYFNRKE